MRPSVDLRSDGFCRFWSLDRGPNHDQPTVGSRDSTFDEDEVVFLDDLDDVDVLDCTTSVAVLSGHLGAFEDASRVGAGADGATVAEVFVCTVGHALGAFEVVPLHDTREASALGGSGDINKLTCLEQGRVDFLADFVFVEFFL
jgi:hypothetical protein